MVAQNYEGCKAGKETASKERRQPMSVDSEKAFSDYLDSIKSIEENIADATLIVIEYRYQVESRIIAGWTPIADINCALGMLHQARLEIIRLKTKMSILSHDEGQMNKEKEKANVRSG